MEHFLLNVEKTGQNLREKFISECSTSMTRFEESIKRTPIINFTADFAKKEVKIGNKVLEMKMQRDLCGRMLGVSMEYKIDISLILSYPLTPLPLSMCHLDEMICIAIKSTLTKILEKEVDSEPPSSVNVIILDGFR